MSNDIITLAHGAGGRKSSELISELFLRYLGNPTLDALGDAAVLEANGGRIAFTTDSFVVSPLSFPGGDIGKLAVCGTVNDLASMGARPIALSAAFILEEGLGIPELEQIVESMRQTAEEVGLAIVAGDTKVVARGSADRVFITTSGIGLLPGDQPTPAPDRASPGDAVIVSGTIADHGMAVMTTREGLQFSSEIRSDCAPLWGLVSAMLETGAEIHCLRDPTRGGLAAVANELASQSGVCFEIDEAAVPVSPDVRIACELLGIDPLHVANEGKILAVVAPDDADTILAAMREHPLGKHAARIGEVKADPQRRVHLRTSMGGIRVLDVPAGDLLPRIC